MFLAPRSASHRYRILYLVPCLLATLTAVLGMYFETAGIKLRGPGIPLGWGILKDFLDMIIVSIFPWNGWIMLIPLLAAMFLKWQLVELVGLWIALSSAVGIADTLILFPAVTISLCARGIAFYLVIFGFVSVFSTAAVVIGRFVIKRSGKCTQ